VKRLVIDTSAYSHMWIAASAIDSGGHLLTFDKDFGRIEGLDCTILAS
jgi:predicted nucleic acid-binding protein